MKQLPCYIFHSPCLCYTGGEAIPSSAFGAGSVSIVASNVQCFGREYDLGECRNESIIPTECTADRVAGARCVPGSSKFPTKST